MTRDDATAITIMFAFVGAGAVWFYFFDLQTDRYKIMEFCRPRGYTGGFVRNNRDLGCVASDGRRVLIRDIKDAEAPKAQDRFDAR